MHPLLMMELAHERRARLRADAERARLLADARRSGRLRRRPRRAFPFLARRWRRQSSPPGQWSAPTTTSARPAGVRDLAERLAADGPIAVESELRRFVDLARLRGATPVLVSILADVSQPDVARQPAFGKILVELDEQRRNGAQSSLDIPHAA